jgi:hypothetical protein
MKARVCLSLQADWIGECGIMKIAVFVLRRFRIDCGLFEIIADGVFLNENAGLLWLLRSTSNLKML